MTNGRSLKSDQGRRKYIIAEDKLFSLELSVVTSLLRKLLILTLRAFVLISQFAFRWLWLAVCLSLLWKVCQEQRILRLTLETAQNPNTERKSLVVGGIGRTSCPEFKSKMWDRERQKEEATRIYLERLDSCFACDSALSPPPPPTQNNV